MRQVDVGSLAHPHPDRRARRSVLELPPQCEGPAGWVIVMAVHQAGLVGEQPAADPGPHA